MWGASYLPFGGVRVTTGAPVALRFPGQWYQAESGLPRGPARSSLKPVHRTDFRALLTQNRMRDYDPATDRHHRPDAPEPVE